jgi:hypothetical protein
MPPRREYFESSEFNKPEGSSICFPEYTPDWDRWLNVYNIIELPEIPPDGDSRSENLPVSIKILRQLFLDAASKFATEVWFDFEPDISENEWGRGAFVDACYSHYGKGIHAVRMPQKFFFQDDSELGIFRYLLEDLSDDGMFKIQTNEFKDIPVKQDPDGSTDGSVFPGLAETIIIRAFRVSLKGHEAPQDLVIQICPRFWHMPTGFRMD